MNWIRVATAIKDDPSVHAIARECCKNDIAKAVGHVVNILAECAKHARTGDLSHLDAMTVEHWALWRGKKGAFDTAFRTHLCRDGVVRSWEKYNGAPIREADAARARMQAKRGKRHDTE